VEFEFLHLGTATLQQSYMATTTKQETPNAAQLVTDDQQKLQYVIATSN